MVWNFSSLALDWKHRGLCPSSSDLPLEAPSRFSSGRLYDTTVPGINIQSHKIMIAEIKL